MFLTKSEITEHFKNVLFNIKNDHIQAIVSKYKDNVEALEDIFSDVYEQVVEELNPFKYDPVTPLQFIEDPYYCGKNPLVGVGVCETMYSTLKENFCKSHDLKSGIREIILSGCVDINSIIQEADGGLPSLKERLGKNENVLVLKNGIETSETINTRHSGIQPVYKITLENGMELKLTEDHKVQTFISKETWIATKNLKVGTYLYIPRYIKTNPSSNIDDNLIKLHAYILTNGSYDSTRLRYSSANDKTVIEFLQCIENIGFTGKITSPKDKKIRVFHSTKYKQSGLLEWCQKNIQKYTREMVVDESICKSSNEKVALFLNRVFGAEGCIYIPKSDTKSPPRIQLAMLNERFIRQIQLLLLRFGVQSRINYLRQYDKRINKARYIWNLVISGISNFKRFFNEIGLIYGKEENSLKILDYCREKKANTNIDVLPFTANSLKRYIELFNIPLSSRFQIILCNKKMHMSWELFDEFLEEIKNTKLHSLLKRMFPSDIGFCKISKIEKLDESIEVGDIGAFNGNRFICNGIGVHNSIGWGKSFFMSLGLVWNLYILSCLKQPQIYFQLGPGSKIAVMIISITEKQAKKNMFSNCKEMVGNISYFKENFMYDPKRATDSLIFDNNIELFSGTSTQSSSIGLNIYSAALDEANFFKIIQQSKRARSSDGEFDEALTLYYSLVRRQESRYLKKGRQPGILYLGSSNVYPDDFTAKRIKAAKDTKSTSTYVMSYSQWSVCREKFGQEEFKVELGGMFKNNRILEGYETDVTGETISVPMEFYDAFKKDLDNALRDLAGLALYSVQPFFGEREKIHDIFDSSLQKIFTRELATLSPKYITEEHIINHIIRNKKQPRYIAIDVGLKKDLLGFAMGHISQIIPVKRQLFNDMTGKMDYVIEKLPYIEFDMLLSVKKEEEFGEVELQRILNLIYNLRKYGYKIRFSSADGFQSAHIQQVLKRNGIKNEYISMDRTLEPYETFRSAVYDGRVKCPYNAILEKELIQLEKDYVNNKVDHPVKGSKDLADAVGQVVYNCHMNMSYFDDALLASSSNVSFKRSKEETIEEEIERIRHELRRSAGIEE